MPLKVVIYWCPKTVRVGTVFLAASKNLMFFVNTSRFRRDRWIRYPELGNSTSWMLVKQGEQRE
jgi:hypothetical protein